MASTTALYNNGDSLGKVDWTRERETFLHLLFSRYELYSHDKEALEEIFQRAYPEFRRCNRDATALYDRWQPRWADGRKGLNWRQIDRTDSRNTYNQNPYTQQELDDFKTLDAVILLWAAHIAKPIQPIAGAGPDLTHGVANPTGILHSLTTTPGHRHAALLPGEALPAPMRLYLESHPATGGAPIYDFTLRNTIGVDAFPVFGPKKVKKRSKAQQSLKKKSAKTPASTGKKRAREDSDADEIDDDDEYEPTAHKSKKRRVMQPRYTKRVKKQSPADDSVDEYEADVSDEDQDTTVHGPTKTSSVSPSSTEPIVEQNGEALQPMGNEPYQLPMAHYSRLFFDDSEIRFRPGSTMANSIDLGPDSEVFKFGGYVHIITVDENAPLKVQASGHTIANMTVCNKQVCEKCMGDGSGEQIVLPKNHSWDIVYRQDLLELDDSTLLFVGREDDKVPRYTTKLPMSAIEREVVFGWDADGVVDQNAVLKVLVCEDPDENDD